jgi:hypothetical protein
MGEDTVSAKDPSERPLIVFLGAIKKRPWKRSRNEDAGISECGEDQKETQLENVTKCARRMESSLKSIDPGEISQDQIDPQRSPREAKSTKSLAVSCLSQIFIVHDQNQTRNIFPQQNPVPIKHFLLNRRESGSRFSVRWFASSVSTFPIPGKSDDFRHKHIASTIFF